MKLKHFCIAAVFTILPYLIGCGSGSYKIENSEKNDTTTFKSTGAKLKNFYKIQNPPHFTLQVSGGLNLGMAELSSNFQNNFDSTQFSKGLNFGVKNGFGVSVTGKIPLHIKGNVRLNITGAFNRFKSDFLASSSPFGHVSYNVITLGVGVENSFNPSFRLKPYLAGEIQANMISGNASIVSPTTQVTRDVKFKNTFRIGYMIYGGIEYMFNNRVGMNFGVKLTNSNQLIKTSPKSDNPNEVPLRDQKIDGDANQLEFAGFKNFIYTSVFAGVNFYFGVKDIVYQFNK
jgi:hypothetical protein